MKRSIAVLPLGGQEEGQTSKQRKGRRKVRDLKSLTNRKGEKREIRKAPGRPKKKKGVY